HGGVRPQYMGMIPWLAFATLVATLVVPQRKRGESHAGAQRRVLRAIPRDPVMWAFAILLLLLWLQNLNSPRMPVAHPPPPGEPYVYQPPPVPWLPVWAVHSEMSLDVLYWFVMAFAVVLGARHGLLKASRRKLLLFCCWNGALLALFGIAQLKWMSRLPPEARTMYGLTPMKAHYFATFGYQNHAGQFFTFLFILSAALFLQRVENEEGPAWKTGLLVAPVALNFAGAILAVSRASILMAVFALVVFGLYAIARLWPAFGWGARARILVVAALAVGVAAAWYLLTPGNTVENELKGTDRENVHNRVFENYQVPAAMRMWADHRFFGVGGWGYRFHVSQYVPAEEWNQTHGAGQANVHNDLAQFLAEHGAVGASAFLFILLALLWPCAKHLFLYQTPEYNWKLLFFRFPLVPSLTLAAALFMVLDSVVDIPFRSPPCLAMFCLGLICAPAYSPASWRRHPTGRGSRA
ncbi:MAG: O-antigen ligase family protein, partial [Kiritimatiellaeota bacterium]|nr:O-antigen ligase family protein [Kiritimatiellota bacterium]